MLKLRFCIGAVQFDKIYEVKRVFISADYFLFAFSFI